MNKNLFLAIILLIISSCTDDIANSFDKADELIQTKSTKNEIPVVNSLEEVAEVLGMNSCSKEKDLSPKLSLRSEIPELTASGFTRKSTLTPESKMSFKPDFAKKIGVPPYTVYLVRMDKYEKDIETAGKTFFQVSSSNCGGTPTITDGYEGTNWELLGYRVQKTGNPTTLATHLMYINCTFPGGAAIKKYYPYKPELLKWNYYLW